MDLENFTKRLHQMPQSLFDEERKLSGRQYLISLIAEAYFTGEMVVLDAYTFREYKAGRSKTIDHKINGVWIELEPMIQDYDNYSHGMNEKRVKQYDMVMWKMILEARKLLKENGVYDVKR